jgi:cytochrome P450
MGYVRRQERAEEPGPKGCYISFLGHLKQDPFAALHELGNHPPFWLDDAADVDGYWVVTRFEDVREVLQDAQTFSNLDAQIPFIQMEEPLLPTESDPPFTQKLRAIIMPSLTAARIKDKEARVRQVCRETIERFRTNHHCDAVRQYAEVFPITIFLEFYGLDPAYRKEFARLAFVVMHDAHERATAWGKILEIAQAELLRKRGSDGTDLLSVIANGKIDGQPIDLKTATSVAAQVFVGGLDTLASNITWGLWFLATHPAHRSQLVDDPGLIPGAVEEFLRNFAVANPMRRLTRDVAFHGANMRAGDRVLCSTAAANRDVSRFGDAVDFARTENPHLTFSTGPHRCVGSHLVRLELAVSLEIWHELIPDYRLAPDAELSYQGPVFAMDRLPLVWDG